MLVRHTTISLVYFIIIAFLGLILRLFAVTDIPVNYKFIVHTHSHIALLGWVYTALTTLLYFAYLRSQPIEKKYRIIFWFTQLTIVGMLLTFPFTGYALLSIIFSTLFLIASYWFVYFFFRNCPEELKSKNSYKLIRISLWYMVISSIGPWALGIIMNTAGSGSSWYRNAIYFYLHFQYNGWFIVAICGIFLAILERNDFTLPPKIFSWFYNLLNAGVILTFFLSLLWMKPHTTIYFLAFLGGLLQLIAFVLLFIRMLQRGRWVFNSFPSLVNWSFKLVAGMLVVKLLAQIFGVFPIIADNIFTNLDMIISYIHWIFLGVVSVSLFGYLKYFRLLKLTGFQLNLYLAGFFLTEILIFSRGFSNFFRFDFPSVHLLISLASLVLFIAITLILAGQLRKST